MKTLKTIVLALFLTSANFVSAQIGNMAAEEKAKLTTKELTQSLGLTGDQEKKVSDAAVRQAKQLETNKTTYKDDKEGMKKANRQSMEAFEGTVKTILTPDQKTKYEQMLKDKGEDRFKGL